MPCPLQMEKRTHSQIHCLAFLKIISKDLYMQATDFQAQEAPKLMSAAKLTHKSCNSLDSLSNNGMIQDFHLQKAYIFYCTIVHMRITTFVCPSFIILLIKKEGPGMVCAFSKFPLQLTSPCGSQMSNLNRGRLCHRHQ